MFKKITFNQYMFDMKGRLGIGTRSKVQDIEARRTLLIGGEKCKVLTKSLRWHEHY